MELGSILLLVAAVILVISGLAGLVLPVLPGSLLLFLGLLLAAWAEDFAYIGGWTITILALLMIVSYAADFLAGALGAKQAGASRRATVGAMIGAVIGIFFGFVGIIIGPFIGAFIGQITVKKDVQNASLVGFGAWIGLLLGTAVKVAVGIAMISIYILVRYL